MKNKYLLIISFFSTMQLSAQYVNIIDTNALWSVWDTEFYIQGDTAIGGTDYQIVYQKKGPTPTAIKYGYIREDTATQSLYIRGFMNDELLYDFSLNDGDTINIVSFNTTLVVDSVDHITLGGVLRKRMKMSVIDPFGSTTWLGEYWIEGIGSTYGLPYSGFFVSDVTFPKLLCYQLNGVTVYKDSNFTNCYEPWPLNVEENEISRIKIHPNPAASFINIQLPPNVHRAIVRVYNLNGALLLKQELTQNETRIDLEALQLAPQTFLVEIDAEGKVYYKKVVVR